MNASPPVGSNLVGVRNDWKFLMLSLLLGALSLAAGTVYAGALFFGVAAILAWLRHKGRLVQWILTVLAVLLSVVMVLVSVDSLFGFAELRTF